jgi:putative transposase
MDHLLQAVAEVMAIPPAEVMAPGKWRQRVRARSLLCYWAVRELGMTMTAMALKSGLSVPAIGMAVRRGEEIVREMNLALPDVLKL